MAKDIFQVSLAFDKADWDIVVAGEYIELCKRTLLLGRARYIQDDEESKVKQIFDEMQQIKEEIPVYVVTNGETFDTFVYGVFVHTGTSPLSLNKALEIIRNLREEK